MTILVVVGRRCLRNARCCMLGEGGRGGDPDQGRCRRKGAGVGTTRSTRGGTIGLVEAVSIGVGGMVGGGIFAVLGLAVSVGGGGTFVSFAIAGLVALLTTYSYARLAVALPSDGGTVTFLDAGFGAGRVAGSLNVLLWLAYVVTTALYAFAFGSYGATFLPDALQAVGLHVLITVAVLAVAVLNVFSAKLIGAAEDYVVAGKLAILVVFVLVALTQADLSRSAPSTWEPLPSLVAGGMLIFVAYEGFELIANSAQDVRNPTRTLPRAFYTSVLFTMALYVLVALVTVGLLTQDQIARSADFALAEAAQVVWGRVGFTLIVVAALLSTVSAINATLYGTARLSVDIALDGELPSELERKVAGRPLFGLIITAVLALLLANLVSLSAISTLASVAFLVIFAAVNVAAVRLADRIGARRWIPAAGALACAGATVSLLVHTAQTSPADLVLVAVMIVLTFVGEATYQSRRRARDGHLET